ncbi:MAG: hypothetical protein JW717_12875 [Marinilabiliaceae bacterium]|nr:hypothetical protein [Marinilabiliaceae bacterium]
MSETGDKEKFIVSLTTFPARINKVWLTIETILHQTEKPDKIILWLYKGEFESKDVLPLNLLRLESRGLEIHFCEDNLMPHKKYFYSMLEYPDDNIITIDDDVFYPPTLIEKLKKTHKCNPAEVIAVVAREICIGKHEFLPYSEWKTININTLPSFLFLPVGAGSVFYPSGSLNSSVFDKNKLFKLALKADDLWLKIMSVLNNTRVIVIGGVYSRLPMPVIYKNNVDLMSANVGLGHNDLIFKNLISEFNISPDNFYEVQ